MYLILFSKMLKNVGSLSVDEAGDLIAEIGFDGVDLTVRPGGHVLPDEVEKDLPEAVEILKSKGLAVPMITSNITDADEKYAEEIFKTASESGVQFIKLGYWRYQDFGKIKGQIKRIRDRNLKGISKLSEEYGVTAGVHTHSGDFMSAEAAVLWMLLRNYDPNHVCAYIDPGHMLIEGGLSGWKMGMDLLQEYIRMVAVKDFGWYHQLFLPPTPSGKRWKIHLVPLSEGLVPWPEVFSYLQRIGFDGPASLHSEYHFQKFGDTIRQTKEDLGYLRNVLKRVGFKHP